MKTRPIKLNYLNKKTTSKARYTRYFINESFKDRFFKKVKKSSYCWNWIGAKCGKRNDMLNKYGYLTMNKIQFKAHRVSWVIHNGKIPNNLHVLHKCDNVTCVNPSHLWLGTHQDNMRDKLKKGRNCKGSKHPRARLNEKSAKFIKNNIGKIRIIEMSKILKVTFNTVWKVVNGYSWNHIKISS